MSQQSQFSLLAKRRFPPFSLTQFFGAFNDNVFKQALILAILGRTLYADLLMSGEDGVAGDPVPADQVTAQLMESRVAELRGDAA